MVPATLVEVSVDGGRVGVCVGNPARVMVARGVSLGIVDIVDVGMDVAVAVSLEVVAVVGVRVGVSEGVNVFVLLALGVTVLLGLVSAVGVPGLTVAVEVTTSDILLMKASNDPRLKLWKALTTGKFVDSVSPAR